MSVPTQPDQRFLNSVGPYTSTTAIVVNTPYTVARGLMVSCTAAGAVVAKMLDGTTVTFTPAVGTFFYPLATININSSAGTCTFAAMN